MELRFKIERCFETLTLNTTHVQLLLSYSFVKKFIGSLLICNVENLVSFLPHLSEFIFHYFTVTRLISPIEGIVKYMNPYRIQRFSTEPLWQS
jgi:hypothetical protein